MFDLPDESNIQYKFNSGEINRDSKLLIDNVTSFHITYKTEDGATITPPVNHNSLLWTIEIEIVVSIEGQSFPLEAMVSPRKFYF